MSFFLTVQLLTTAWLVVRQDFWRGTIGRDPLDIKTEFSVRFDFELWLGLELSVGLPARIKCNSAELCHAYVLPLIGSINNFAAKCITDHSKYS